jgi:cell division protein ZapA
MRSPRNLYLFHYYISRHQNTEQNDTAQITKILSVSLKAVFMLIYSELNCIVRNTGGRFMTQDDKTRVTVDIYNKSYKIVGKESANHVRLVASLVDQKMREIQAQSPNLDTTRLAVLTAVNTMNDHLKLKEEYASLLGSLRGKEEK